MVTNGSLFDCSPLDSQKGGFKDYITQLREQTGFNSTYLQFCESEICGAVWGIGNSDVSGIGLVSAYITQVVFGFLLSSCCYACRQKIGNRRLKSVREIVGRPAEKGLDTFFFSALYFTISILVASNYALARRDFDISADGFGMLEMNITSAITVISVLPLLYPMILGEAEETTNHSHNLASTEKSKYNRQLRHRYRLVLSGTVLALFMYPFISQCTHNWATTDIGEGKGPGGTTIVTLAEWDLLSHTCFGKIKTLSYDERRAMAILELVASLLYIAATLWVLLTPMYNKSRLQRLQKLWHVLRFRAITWVGNVLKGFTIPLWLMQLYHVFFLLCPVILSIFLISGIFRLREIQQALARATNNVYTDNQWGFGQVMAIVVFAPVILDMVQCYFEIQ